MFDEPTEDPIERAFNPADRVREKSDEFRMHAELVAVFEGTRKFDAAILPGLDPDLAREIQRTMGRLAKAKSVESPILPPPSVAEAAALLEFPKTRELSTKRLPRPPTARRSHDRALARGRSGSKRSTNACKPTLTRPLEGFEGGRTPGARMEAGSADAGIPQGAGRAGGEDGRAISARADPQAFDLRALRIRPPTR